MRNAIAVVVAFVALATGMAAADESATRGDRLYCSERCDDAYESCMRWRRGKGTQDDCPGDLVRCKQSCEPGSGGATAATRSAAAKRLGLSCRDRCQDDYDACIRRDTGKNDQACAKNVMLCRSECPQEPSRPVGVSAPSTEAPTVSHSKVPSSGSAEPQRATPPPAVERRPPPEIVRQTAPAPKAVTEPGAQSESAREAAAATPAAAEPATPPRVTAPAAPPPPREVAAAPVAPAPAAAERHVAETTEDHARPHRPSVWSRTWCAITGSCGGSVAQAPLSCPDACTRDYDECVAREDPKRGGACATQSLRCRQRCDEQR